MLPHCKPCADTCAEQCGCTRPTSMQPWHMQYRSSCACRCGPCKVMLPHLEQMAGELGDSVRVVKFNCSKENKDLGKQLGIRVAPTFHLYKKSEKVGMSVAGLPQGHARSATLRLHIRVGLLLQMDHCAKLACSLSEHALTMSKGLQALTTELHAGCRDDWRQGRRAQGIDTAAQVRLADSAITRLPAYCRE